MRVAKEQSEQNRAALVVAARRLFRQRGFASVTVADIAGAAGLTHGAFYSHFRNKREIEALATASIIDKAANDWKIAVEENAEGPLAALIEGYLAFDHLSEGDVGCAFAALGSDLARGDQQVRAAACMALPRQIAVLEALFDDENACDRRGKALAAYASLVGAAIIVSVINDAELARDINTAVAKTILSQRPAP